MRKSLDSLLLDVANRVQKANSVEEIHEILLSLHKVAYHEGIEYGNKNIFWICQTESMSFAMKEIDRLANSDYSKILDEEWNEVIGNKSNE